MSSSSIPNVKRQRNGEKTAWKRKKELLAETRKDPIQFVKSNRLSLLSRYRLSWDDRTARFHFGNGNALAGKRRGVEVRRRWRLSEKKPREILTVKIQGAEVILKWIFSLILLTYNLAGESVIITVWIWEATVPQGIDFRSYSLVFFYFFINLKLCILFWFNSFVAATI